MGKKSRKKRKYRDLNYSGLAAHKMMGKTLITPLNKIQQMSRTSWRDDHAPEMLWAFLLATTFPRDDYLSCFRAIANWAHKTFQPSEPKINDQSNSTAPQETMLNVACEVDHTSLAELSDKHFGSFLDIPLRHPLGYAALRPLLLLESIPGVKRWREKLAVEPPEDGWNTLSDAVIATLDHQSEKSTDIRWLKLVLEIVLQKLMFPNNMQEQVKEVLDFPNRGDMHKVRPFIRAGEMTFRRNPPSPWIERFWAELLIKTGCADGSHKQEYFKHSRPALSRDLIFSTRCQLSERFEQVESSSRTDARLDATFGFVLYALSLLEEIAAPPMSELLVGRVALRTLAEVVITFAYLLKKDDRRFWTAYRNYGSGQAKLAFLKLEESVGDQPSFVDQDTLFEIANEDTWQEFVNVDLGHWAKKNLRDLAIESGEKELYDRFYDWTSTFAHGHWCAVRDSNFVTCHNPLHRLHRIPRPYHRIMPSVIPEAVRLVNRTFDLLEAAYPSMDKLGRIQEVASFSGINTPASDEPEKMV